MKKPGSFMEKHAISVQDDCILTMVREDTGKRNCLGFINHVKDFELAFYCNGKVLKNYQNMNDKYI